MGEYAGIAGQGVCGNMEEVCGRGVHVFVCVCACVVRVLVIGSG